MVKDLIVADQSGTELGVLTSIKRCDMQVADSWEENDNTFEIDMTLGAWKKWRIRKGFAIYFSGTEWGGLVSGLRVATGDQTITLTGRTWRGQLGTKACRPADGVQYITCSGDLQAVIRQLIGSRFDGKIIAGSNTYGTAVNRRSRHINLYRLLTLLLADAGAKLNVVYTSGRVIVTALPVADHSGTVWLNDDYGISYTATDSETASANHIIALGKGEGLQRVVLDFWRIPGGWTDNPNHPARPQGLSEIDYIYDYPNAEDEEELRKGAIEKLSDIRPIRSMEMDLGRLSLDGVDIGDIIGCEDPYTGLRSAAPVHRKILTIDSGKTEIRYVLKEV